jgi:hypothetical protein
MRELAASVPQRRLEGREAFEVLSRWLRGQATAEECGKAAEAAWEIAVREWAKAGLEWANAASQMASAVLTTGTDDQRVQGDAAAAPANAARTATGQAVEAASSTDDYSKKLTTFRRLQALLSGGKSRFHIRTIPKDENR